MIKILKRIFNGVSFYFGWFLAVDLAAKGRPFESLLAALLFVTIHLIFIAKKLREVVIVLIFMGFGFILDTAFLNAGLVTYASPNTWLPWAVPFWVLGLHALFATTLNYAMSWLKPHAALSAILGAMGGFFTYVAGHKMGGVFFHYGMWSPIAIGAVWFFYVPFAFYFVDSVLGKMEGGTNGAFYKEE